MVILYVLETCSHPTGISSSCGASHGGEGGLGKGEAHRKAIFGSHLEPMLLGSGDGAHGGGAINVNVKTLTINGRVSAK